MAWLTSAFTIGPGGCCPLPVRDGYRALPSARLLRVGQFSVIRFLFDERDVGQLDRRHKGAQMLREGGEVLDGRSRVLPARVRSGHLLDEQRHVFGQGFGVDSFLLCLLRELRHDMRLLAQFEGERRELPPGLCHEACAAGSFQGTRGTGARRLQRRLLELFAKAVELRADRSRALSDESEVLGYTRRFLPLLSRKGFEELRILCQQAEVLDDVGERLYTLTDV